MRFMLCILVFLASQDDPFQELQNVRSSIREKSVAAQELQKSAHEALDLGEYETATSRHRKSVELGKAIVELKKRELALIEKAIPPLLTLLDAESADVRDQASARLIVLGPKALPFLEGREKEGSVEVRSRLAGVLVRL